MKSQDQNSIWLTTNVLIKRHQSDPGSFRLMKEVCVAVSFQNLLVISQNMLESYDSTIALRSNGNHALK